MSIFVHDQCKNGILLPKLFWPTVKKIVLEIENNFLDFEAEGQKFAKKSSSLKHFARTLIGQYKF